MAFHCSSYLLLKWGRMPSPCHFEPIELLYIRVFNLLELPLPDGQRGAQGHASATPASISALKGVCTLALAVSSATSFPRVSACVVKWMRADQIAR